MKYYIYTLLFFIVNTLLFGNFDNNQKEYISIYGGYYKDLVKKNEKLTQESIKLGVKKYGHKDLNKNDSFQEYLGKKELVNDNNDNNIEIEKYNNTLNEYYYPQLELLHTYREKVDFTENPIVKAKLEKKLKEINTLFEIILNALSTNDIKRKENTCLLMKKYKEYELLKNKPNLSKKEKIKLNRKKDDIEKLINQLKVTNSS